MNIIKMFSINHHSIFFLLLVLAKLTTTICNAENIGDHFGAGFKLNVSSRVCSQSSNYCMYFRNAYLAIHDTLTSQKVIWIANRNQPLLNTNSSSSSSAILTLDMFGVLKIIGQNEEPIIILYSPSTNHDEIKNVSSIEATLFDTGNLMLQQTLPNGSKKVLWQSFDYPTDTLIPGMKLGFEKGQAGKNWSLVSNFGDFSADEGPFSLDWEPTIRQLLIRRRGQVYWTSGVLRDDGKFENIPTEAQTSYKYITISNTSEESFMFTIEDETERSYYPSSWTLYFDGKLTSKRDELANAGNCYGYNNDGGCLRRNLPPCRHVGQIFEVTEVRATEREMTFVEDDSENLSISDCEANCWSDCDCVGFSSVSDEGRGCNYIYENYKGAFIGNDSLIINFLVQRNPNTNQDSPQLTLLPSKKIKWLIPIIVIAAVFIILALIILVLWRKRKLMLEVEEMKRTRHASETSNEYKNVNELQNYKENNGRDLRLFSYASILEATENFSLENKLGQGGFGPVYKGKLQVGIEVAVKRLSRRSRQGVKQFKNELKLISELQHMNLVQLLGCCIHEEERILIYEYMPNKSLDFFLFDSTRSKLLEWKERFNIIEGIGQGLIYLHKYSRLKVVHRDLKASNVLLDENMNPKISDFGLARIIMEESERSTTRIAGTCGYMAPESAKGTFSTKSDVYSFGIMILEIVSGRRNNSFYHTSQGLNIVGHAWELWKENMALELVDPAIKNSVIEDQVMRCIHVGLSCVEECANDRPSMGDISSMLTSESAKLPSLKRPAFCYVRDSSILRSSNDSPNGLTISDLSAR